MESLENSLKRGLFGLRPLALPVLRNVLPPNLISTDQSNAIGSVLLSANARNARKTLTGLDSRSGPPTHPYASVL